MINYDALTDEELARFALDDKPGAREKAVERLAELAADPYCIETFQEGIEEGRRAFAEDHGRAIPVLEAVLKQTAQTLTEAQLEILGALRTALDRGN